MSLICRGCSSIIEKAYSGKRKFCSRSCAASFNNRAFPKRRRGSRDTPGHETQTSLVNCMVCNITLKPHQKKYCSNRCQQAHVFETHTLPRIVEGLVSNPKTLKKYLLGVKGDVCSLCGQGPTWNHKRLILQLDHIDGNSDNCSPNNLRLLCPNCHTQTDTYGSRGVGSRYRKNSKRNVYLRQYKGYV